MNFVTKEYAEIDVPILNVKVVMNAKRLSVSLYPAN